MKNSRYIFPMFFTVCNALCGFLSIIYIVADHTVAAAWLILLASVFDAMDGKVARFTKTCSEFGIESDSLADIISFGVAPAVLIYKTYFYLFGYWGLLISFLPVLFGGIRLARFNLQMVNFAKESYIGLTIPMTGITLSSFIIFNYNFWGELRFSIFMLPLVIFLCVLMVSTVEFDTLPKFSLRDTRKNFIKLVIFLVCSAIIAIFPREAMFPAAISFIFFGIFRWLIHTIKSSEVVDIFTSKSD